MKKNLAVISALLVTVLLVGGASVSTIFATGARTTGAVVQNLGNTAATVRLDYYNQAGATVATTQTVIQPASAVGFSAGSQTGLTDGFVGSLVVSADQPIAAVGNDTDSDSVGFFSAVTQGAKKLYVPAVYRNPNGWNSEIWIQAVEQVPANSTATLKYYNRQGELVTTKTANLISYATVKVTTADNADLPVGTAGWAGGVVIESDYNIGAVVKNMRNTSAGMIAEMYNAFTAGDTEVYVPAIYKGNTTWDSNGINVQNLGTVSTTVSIDFYDRAGTKLTTYDFPSAFVPGGAQAINTKNVAALGTVYAGTAVVKSSNANAPVVAIVDVTSSPKGMGNAYNAALKSEGATTVYLPSQYRSAGGWRSGVIAMNIGDTPTPITIEFYKRGETTASAVTNTTVSKYIAFAVNTFKTTLPAGWSGTVVVKSTQPVVVVGNVEGGFTSNAGKAGMYNAFPKP